MSENWLPVVGWEGIYEVSDQGRVRSLDRIVHSRWKTGKPVKGRILSENISKSTGYKRCTLVDAATSRRHYANVHRLVLEAFVGPCPPGLECCHNNNDRANAALSNLRWDTRSSNTLDAVRQKTHGQSRKMHCPNGHPYDAYDGSGRYCRQCKAARDRARYDHAERHQRYLESKGAKL